VQPERGGGAAKRNPARAAGASPLRPSKDGLPGPSARLHDLNGSNGGKRAHDLKAILCDLLPKRGAMKFGAGGEGSEQVPEVGRHPLALETVLENRASNFVLDR